MGCIFWDTLYLREIEIEKMKKKTKWLIEEARLKYTKFIVREE